MKQANIYKKFIEFLSEKDIEILEQLNGGVMHDKSY